MQVAQRYKTGSERLVYDTTGDNGKFISLSEDAVAPSGGDTIHEGSGFCLGPWNSYTSRREKDHCKLIFVQFQPNSPDSCHVQLGTHFCFHGSLQGNYLPEPFGTCIEENSIPVTECKRRCKTAALVENCDCRGYHMDDLPEGECGWWMDSLVDAHNRVDLQSW